MKDDPGNGTVHGSKGQYRFIWGRTVMCRKNAVTVVAVAMFALAIGQVQAIDVPGHRVSLRDPGLLGTTEDHRLPIRRDTGKRIHVGMGRERGDGSTGE